MCSPICEASPWAETRIEQRIELGSNSWSLHRQNNRRLSEAEECLLILTIVIESSARPPAVVGRRLSGKPG